MSGICRVLGIDPGAKPGWAWVGLQPQPGHLLKARFEVICCGTFFSKIPLKLPDTTACIEDQYFGKAGKKSVKTLAFRAGQAQGYIQDRVVSTHSLSPIKWRTVLFGGNLTKEVSCNRVLLNLPKDLQDGIRRQGGSEDVLDAIGIAWAASLLISDGSARRKMPRVMPVV